MDGYDLSHLTPLGVGEARYLSPYYLGDICFVFLDVIHHALYPGTGASYGFEASGAGVLL